jgi:hypothetical protein
MAYARELAFSGRRYQGLDFKVRLVRVMAKTEQVLYEYQELTRYEVTFGKEIEGTKVTLDTLPLFDFPEKATDAAAKLSSLGYWTTVKQLPKNASFLRPPFGGDALVEVKET